MLMADMNEEQRKAVRQMASSWLPEGAELIESVDILWSGWECDHAMALYKMPDGSVHLHRIAETPIVGDDEPLTLLENRIAEYERVAGDTIRFIEIAKQMVALDG